MKLNRPLILALAAATIVAAATDCSKFNENEKKCTKKEKCKYEQGECVAKSFCEKHTKKGKCKKAAGCKWKKNQELCIVDKDAGGGESDGFNETTQHRACQAM